MPGPYAHMAGAQWESIEQMLQYQPTDGKTWEEIHDRYDWEHPGLKGLVADLKRRGVRETIEVDYEQDPPTVEEGHVRVLAAQKAGIEYVPIRQYERGPDE